MSRIQRIPTRNILATITLLTIFFPQWFDTIPIEKVTAQTKELIHWAFKGVDGLVAAYALLKGVNKTDLKQ